MSGHNEQVEWAQLETYYADLVSANRYNWTRSAPEPQPPDDPDMPPLIEGPAPANVRRK